MVNSIFPKGFGSGEQTRFVFFPVRVWRLIDPSAKRGAYFEFVRWGWCERLTTVVNLFAGRIYLEL